MSALFVFGSTLRTHLLQENLHLHVSDLVIRASIPILSSFPCFDCPAQEDEECNKGEVSGHPFYDRTRDLSLATSPGFPLVRAYLDPRGKTMQNLATRRRANMKAFGFGHTQESARRYKQRVTHQETARTAYIKSHWEASKRSGGHVRCMTINGVAQTIALGSSLTQPDKRAEVVGNTTKPIYPYHDADRCEQSTTNLQILNRLLWPKLLFAIASYQLLTTAAGSKSKLQLEGKHRSGRRRDVLPKELGHIPIYHMSIYIL